MSDSTPNPPTIPAKSKHGSPPTQDDRFQSVVHAIWFSAQSYVPPEEGKPMMLIIEVDHTAHCVISILDDLGLISQLPDNQRC